MNPHHLTESNEHYTPPEIIIASFKTMGEINLDPASCHQANQWVGTENFYDIEDNGLNQQWHGNIFLNPPGGVCQDKSAIARYGVKSSQAVWAEKLLEEWEAKRVKQAVFVAFNLEISRYCQWLDRFPFCRPIERVKYYSVDPTDGKIKSGQWSNIQKKWTDASPHATILFYFPPQNQPLTGINRFIKHFQHIGVCRNGYDYIFTPTAPKNL
jgi:hypothetical protein